MLHDPLASSLAMLVVGGLSVAMFLTFGRRHGVVLIATLAFAVRVLRGIQVQVTGDVSDGISYDAFGVALSRFWSDTGPDPGTWLGKDGFPALLGVIYTNVGHAPEVGYLLNAFAGGLAVLVVAATTAQMGWLTAVRPAAWIVALWPIGIVWGGMLLRESIVTLLLAVGLWGAVRLYKLHVASGTVAILGAGVAMIFMRGGLAFLLLVGMPLVAVVVTNVRGRASPGRWLLAIGAGAVAVLAISVLSGYFEGGRYFEYRAEVSQEQNSGTSSFSEAGLGSLAADQSLIGHAYRVPLTALGPWPWQVTNLSLAQAWLDALLWLAAWALAIYATVRLRKRVEALLFIVPTVALIIALAANSSNFGLIIRLRGQAIVLLAPLTALGFVLWRERRKDRRMGSGAPRGDVSTQPAVPPPAANAREPVGAIRIARRRPVR